MGPDIKLTYRSTNGDGWLGMGWELEMGAIQRAAKGGVDFDGEKFQFRRPEALLDLVNTSGEYRVKIENEFIRIKQLTSSDSFPQLTTPDGSPYWVATTKAGTRYIFGPTAASRQDDPGIPGNIFKWCLEEIIDTNGNYVKLSYAKDQGQVYLEKIEYSGNINTGALPTTMVIFHRVTNAGAYDVYNTQFRVRTAYNLGCIEVIAKDSSGSNISVSAFKLGYSPTKTGKKLLASLVQYGSDAKVDSSGNITGGSSLPALTMQYSPENTTFTKKTNINSLNVHGAILGDLDGDGKADMYWCGNPTNFAQLSKGDGLNAAISGGGDDQLHLWLFGLVVLSPLNCRFQRGPSG